MTRKPFPELPPGYPFPALEREVLERWRERGIFEKTLEQTQSGPSFVFFEGPPTANNKPHVGHVVTRAVKDLFPRFRTMQGFHVARKAGWDTHGLPVEIEVEKKLGFSGKEQIEQYGIAAFNQACLESVDTYERDWRAMTERTGYWLDLDHAYYTYTNDYIESVWWALSELARRDLLEQGYKIQPYCARCGTTLSSHELAQNYKEADDPSVWVLFPARPGQTLRTVEGGDLATGPELKLVAWTTTPWTLLAHVGLAVHPDLVYRVVAHPDPERDAAGEKLLFGDAIGTPVPFEMAVEGGKRKRLDLRDLPAEARVRGRDLEGLVYDRPFAFGPFDFVGGGAPAPGELDPRQPEGWKAVEAAGFRVVPGDYVTATEGTGLVHTAIPFGEDDYKTGQRYRLPGFVAVDEAGRIDRRAEPFAGLWFKDADPEILRDLKRRGLLLHGDRYVHNYPFCWRCDTPLLYYATTSWFIKTTAKKAELIEKNKTIHWHPEHVGEGRFGNWLENVVDWALSRRRYWGTPLPVWLCDAPDCKERQVIGSFAELFAATGRPLPENPYDREQFDPHRPYIDEHTWACAACGAGTMRRVEEVIDAWFDSGAMPFAQHHYPFENRERFEGSEGERQFPADFISEAVDQTRGWFYTLHALAVLLFDSVAFKNCIVMGHVTDEKGRKMSKRLGNVVDPMAVIEENGADALRWYFYANNPEISSRFSSRLVRESAQGFLLPLANAVSFFTIYANLDGWRPGDEARQTPNFARRPALDRWILLRLDRLVAATTEHLEEYRIPEAARGVEDFLDDLTNWYIRRSRDRFWAPAEGGDEAAKESAYQALYEVLTTVVRLLAPFIPFFTDVLHGLLVRSQDEGAAESVHLEAWPRPAGDRADHPLEAGMAAVQRIVRLGHAARNTHSLKTRQPLAGVTLVTADDSIAAVIEPYLPLLQEELNVHQVRWAADRSEYVRHEVRPVYPKCGPRFGKRMGALKAALEAADGDALAHELEARGRVTVEVEGTAETLTAEELEIRLVERAGTATQGDRELLVALDTELTPELVAEGRAREVVHRIQQARKQANLDYADRIRVRYAAAPELAAAVTEHGTWIAGETLAAALEAVEPATPDLSSLPVDDLAFAFSIEKVS